MPAVDLPLKSSTPDAWAASALADPLALLNDHAHLERKAASNALELLGRYPDPTPPEYWVEKMTAISRDEVEHLAIVTRLLARRGGRLTKYHKNPYANALRDLVRRGEGNLELMDRLMVSALIEARSCERFLALARVASGKSEAADADVRDAELAKLYRGLWASENGHYHTFIDLARQLPITDPSEGARAAFGRIVEARWEQMLKAEAEILEAQPPGPRMHSGLA